MERLTGPVRIYKSHDTAGIDDRGEDVDIKVAVKLLNKEIAPDVIKLKVRNVPTSTDDHPPNSCSLGWMSSDAHKGEWCSMGD